MREVNVRVPADQKPLGVIDVLTAGFEIVRKRPWTLLTPILLDLFIWLTPRLSLANLFRPTLDVLFDPTGLPADAAANVQDMRDAASSLISSLNLLGMVASAVDTVGRMPSLLASTAADVHSPINPLAYTVSVDSGWLAFFLFIPLYLLVLFGSAIYIELVAQGVRPLANAPRWDWLIRAGMLWLKLIVLSLVFALALFIAGAVLLLGQLVTPAGSDISSFIAALVSVGLFWVFIYLFFAVSAMAISGAGILEAMQRSVLLFRVQFWASLILIVLVVFLQRGLSLIWEGLTVIPAGVVLGILANAFIGTALLAATMLFYQDRMALVERLQARVRAARRS